MKWPSRTEISHHNPLDISATRGTFPPHSIGLIREMRVSTKMTLGLSLTCFVIMGIHGYNQLRNENRDLRTAVEREMRLLGDAVRAVVENSLRDRQEQDIQGLLETAD